ncbi:MAG: hypothetical protein Q8884_02600 [Sweet potato little leaf phytoplasma]|nr:hypothetical protein [Sweet potato little leaf phytoplasma]
MKDPGVNTSHHQVEATLLTLTLALARGHALPCQYGFSLEYRKGYVIFLKRMLSRLFPCKRWLQGSYGDVEALWQAWAKGSTWIRWQSQIAGNCGAS